MPKPNEIIPELLKEINDVGRLKSLITDLCGIIIGDIKNTSEVWSNLAAKLDANKTNHEELAEIKLLSLLVSIKLRNKMKVKEEIKE